MLIRAIRWWLTLSAMHHEEHQQRAQDKQQKW